MTVLSLTLPEVGKPDSTEDPKLNTALTTIQNWGNGNIDTSNVKDESLTGKDLGAETLRLLSASTQGAQVGRVSGTEYEPSASRPTFVTVEITKVGGAAMATTFSVGGVVVGKLAADAVAGGITSALAITFLCGPGEKWKGECVNVTSMNSTYRTL